MRLCDMFGWAEVSKCGLPGGPSLDVVYPRDPLRKARFGFIDPVAFAESLGGSFR